MFYLTRHEKAVLVSLGIIVLCGSLFNVAFRSWPSLSQALTFEDRLLHKTDVNSADFDGLVRVPYIGEVTARAIIDYRLKQGRIRSLEELRSITAIYPSNYEKMIRYLKI